MSTAIDASALQDTVCAALEEVCTSAAIEAAETGQLPTAIWSVLAGLELPAALVPEADGGFGLSSAEAFSIVTAAGRAACPVPLPETMLANFVLARAGRPIATDGPAVLAAGPDVRITRAAGGWRIDGTVARVPWGRAARIVLLGDVEGRRVVADLSPGACEVEQGNNIAGEPRDMLRLALTVAEDAVVPGMLDGAWLEAATALLRSCQMVGAMEAVLAMTTGYALDRTQFGRPIARFQAVQQYMATAAGEVAAAAAAASGAAESFGDTLSTPAIAAAKVRTGEAASTVAALAHQIHGAIGFSREYGLQQFTRRLWSWRDEAGNETVWAARLGRHLAATGGDGLWTAITEV